MHSCTRRSRFAYMKFSLEDELNAKKLFPQQALSKKITAALT